MIDPVLPAGLDTELRQRRSSTADQAADLVRRLILEGELAPGAPLREVHLAEALAVSRNTMREALRILAREGLILQDRHHVATVARVTPADVEQIFDVREILELGAIGLAERERHPLDLSRLDSAVARLRAFREGDPWFSIVDADRDFHVGVVALARCPRMDTLYASIESEVRLCLGIVTRFDIVDELVEEHERLRDLLGQRDFDGFRALTMQTMADARERVVRKLG